MRFSSYFTTHLLTSKVFLGLGSADFVGVMSFNVFPFYIWYKLRRFTDSHFIL
jgi:hypothetical protein